MGMRLTSINREGYFLDNASSRTLTYGYASETAHLSFTMPSSHRWELFAVGTVAGRRVSKLRYDPRVRRLSNGDGCSCCAAAVC